MIRKTLTILLIAVVVVSFAAVPQPAYASDYPEIWDTQGDQYLYPGQQSVELYVYLDQAVDGVDLMYRDNGSWYKLNPARPSIATTITGTASCIRARCPIPGWNSVSISILMATWLFGIRILS